MFSTIELARDNCQKNLHFSILPLDQTNTLFTYLRFDSNRRSWCGVRLWAYLGTLWVYLSFSFWLYPIKFWKWSWKLFSYVWIHHFVQIISDSNSVSEFFSGWVVWLCKYHKPNFLHGLRQGSKNKMSSHLTLRKTSINALLSASPCCRSSLLTGSRHPWSSVRIHRQTLLVKQIKRYLLLYYKQ